MCTQQNKQNNNKIHPYQSEPTRVSHHHHHPRCASTVWSCIFRCFFPSILNVTTNLHSLPVHQLTFCLTGCLHGIALDWNKHFHLVFACAVFFLLLLEYESREDHFCHYFITVKIRIKCNSGRKKLIPFEQWFNGLDKLRSVIEGPKKAHSIQWFQVMAFSVNVSVKRHSF